MSKQKQTEEGSRVVVKKKGGCGTFLAGFFCAIIFLVLLIGGAGAYVYFCVNLQQVESVIGVKLPIEGDLNKKTIKDLISLTDLLNCFRFLRPLEFQPLLLPLP